LKPEIRGKQRENTEGTEEPWRFRNQLRSESGSSDLENWKELLQRDGNELVSNSPSSPATSQGAFLAFDSSSATGSAREREN